MALLSHPVPVILMHMTRLLIVVCCLALVACGEKPPPAPQVMEPAAGSGTISGTERIGWDQPAADAVELSKIGYVIYVDGTRTALDNVSCVSSPTITAPVVAFACAARLPTLTPGTHTLELATVIDRGGPRESVRSAPLHVTVAGAATAPPHDMKR
jgi:hypothetical protein